MILAVGSASLTDNIDAPLLQGLNDYLGDAIGSVLSRQPVPNPYLCVSRVCQCVTLVLGGLSKVAFIPMALSASPHQGVGIGIASGNCSSFAVLQFWAANATIQDLMGPQTTNEIVLINRNSLRRRRNIAILCGSFAISIISQLPPGLAAYKYNSDNVRVVAAIITMLSGALVPTRSMQETLGVAMRMRAFNATEKLLYEMRLEMIAIIQTYRRLFIQLGYSEQVAEVDRFGAICQSGNPEENQDTYLDIILTPPHLDKSQPKKKGCLKIGSLLVGSLLAASMQTAYAWFTVENTKKYMKNDDSVAAVFAAVVVGTNIYLTSKAILATTQRVTSSVFNFITRQRVFNLSQQLYPSTTVALRCLGLIANAFAQGAVWKMYGDLFSHDEFRAKYFQCSMSAATFLLLFTATLDIVDDAILYYIRRFGSEPHKEIVLLQDEWNRITRLMSSSSLFDFAVFLTKCPEHKKNALLAKYELTSQRLNEYINSIIARPIN